MTTIDIVGFFGIVALALVVGMLAGMKLGMLAGMKLGKWADGRDKESNIKQAFRSTRWRCHLGAHRGIRALEDSHPAPDGRGHLVKVQFG